MRALPILLLSLLLVISLQQSAADDLVDGMHPGYSYPIYSGYLNLTSDKKIHYMFYEFSAR